MTVKSYAVVYRQVFLKNLLYVVVSIGRLTNSVAARPIFIIYFEISYTCGTTGDRGDVFSGLNELGLRRGMRRGRIHKKRFGLAELTFHSFEGLVSFTLGGHKLVNNGGLKS